MHFALPPRKTSQPPPYARPAIRPPSNARRRRLQLLGYFVLGLLTIYLFCSYLASATFNGDDRDIEPNPSIVVVTMFDEKTQSIEYISMIKANREDYAKRHGYQTSFPSLSNYTHLLPTTHSPDSLTPIPTSWAIVPMLRHSLTLFPTTSYIWYLTPHALITTPQHSLSTQIFTNLSSLMLKDIPVVPPDSVIHTFSHLKPSSAQLIMTQDMDNLAHTNLILRNTPTPGVKDGTDNWAHYFLDAWFDPLYRSYMFQKAENHALEHIVQWHPTILAKLVLVPQRTLNSYNIQPKAVVDNGVKREKDSMWQEGDFVVNLKGCDEKATTKEEKEKAKDGEGRDCGREMKFYDEYWSKQVKELDGTPT